MEKPKPPMPPQVVSNIHHSEAFRRELLAEGFTEEEIDLVIAHWDREAAKEKQAEK